MGHHLEPVLFERRSVFHHQSTAPNLFRRGNILMLKMTQNRELMSKRVNAVPSISSAGSQCWPFSQRQQFYG